RTLAGVRAILGQRVRVQGFERGIGLAERSLETHVIAKNLDVADMANLFDGGELLAGDAIPGPRSPVLECLGDGGVVRLKQRGEISQRLEGDRVHGGRRSTQTGRLDYAAAKRPWLRRKHGCHGHLPGAGYTAGTPCSRGDTLLRRISGCICAVGRGRTHHHVGSSAPGLSHVTATASRPGPPACSS